MMPLERCRRSRCSLCTRWYCWNVDVHTLPADPRSVCQATELSPKHALAYTYLGTELHAQNHTDDALQALEKAIGLDPSIYAAHHNAGMVILDAISDMNQTSEEVELLRDSAAVHFQDALDLEPNSVASTYSLGTTHHAGGRVREALRHYYKVLDLEPNHKKALEKLPELERDARHEDVLDAVGDIDL